MRVKIFFILVCLIIMAFLPIAAAEFTNPQEKTLFAGTYDEENNKKSDEEILCGLTAAQYREVYCEQALEALAVILNTNYRAKPESFDLSDRNVCIFEEDADGSLKENYSKIKAAVQKAYKKTLCVDGKAFFIPFSYISNGHTVKSFDYPYLCSVASSWDCFSDEYAEDARCIGVSMYGVNFLCENGADCAEALKWYLPDFELSG